MGIFHTMTEVVNRTATPKNVRFDGQDMELKPNYTADGKRIDSVRNLIPDVAVDYALAQNVIMGSEEPYDPSSFGTYVGVPQAPGDKRAPAKWQNCEFIDENEFAGELTRVKLDEYLDDPAAKIAVRGSKKRRSTDPISKTLAPFDLRT